MLLITVAAILFGRRDLGGHEFAFASEAHRWTDAGLLSDGDLVFRTGRDMMSRLVLSQGDSPRFSHVGVILKSELGVFVIHALPRDGSSPGGVLVDALNSFASSENASDIAFYRVKGINANSRNKIREYVLRQVGKPFDDEFLLSNDRKVYCTELAIGSFASAGIDIAASLPHVQVMMLAEPVVPPDYLRRSPLLELMPPIKALQAPRRQTARS
ncbi:MAG: YiiX/YebB-like N1pC/P60 family cysteine hydrolase [Sulfuritalea sp.]|nr:YiiX/YebB-like N1pC/P60 family cysteine hydrolase [Sulfuritalea sp.]